MWGGDHNIFCGVSVRKTSSTSLMAGGTISQPLNPFITYLIYSVIDSFMQSGASSDLSDLSQIFEVDDIFTRKDAISGLKSGPWEGLGKLVYTPLDSSILKYDITTN